MIKKPWYPVVYMFVITAFFSSIVIGFAAFTKERVESNKKLAFERAVLESLSLAEDVPTAKIHQEFVEKISTPDADSAGAYIYKTDGELIGYALPIEGKGFWAPIKGIIAIAPDKRTVLGISFYEQNETPGLGAQIETDDFRKQFSGKQLAADQKPLVIQPFGTQLKDNEVEAISGATQTCTRLGILINEDLNKWLDEMRSKEPAK